MCWMREEGGETGRNSGKGNHNHDLLCERGEKLFSMKQTNKKKLVSKESRFPDSGTNDPVIYQNHCQNASSKTIVL